MREMMKKSPRLIAVKILNQVEERGGFAESLLDEILSTDLLTNPPDRRLLTQIVYGTLRMRGHLDWIIRKFYRRSFASMDPITKNILRTGLYQLQFMERIPEFAIVDEAVEISKNLHPAGSGLVNAILRNAIRGKNNITYPELEKDTPGHISAVYSHPLWMVKRWLKNFGTDETIALCRANNETPPITLRVNRLKANRENVKRELIRLGFTVRETAFSPDGIAISGVPIPLKQITLYTQGFIHVQDEASQLISRLVDPKPGTAVLDICAGIGGKTTHLAELMGNRGSILATDISEAKLLALKKNTERLGVTITSTRADDATRDMGETFHGIFNGILVDAPCTGLGTLRRNPEIKWLSSRKDVTQCAATQRKILNTATTYLKKGGRLVYSTCSTEPEENEKVIEDFLSQHRDFACIHPSNTIHSRLVDSHGYFRSFPHHHGTDGFFAAVLERKR